MKTCSLKFMIITAENLINVGQFKSQKSGNYNFNRNNKYTHNPDKMETCSLKFMIITNNLTNMVNSTKMLGIELKEESLSSKLDKNVKR